MSKYNLANHEILLIASLFNTMPTSESPKTSESPTSSQSKPTDPAVSATAPDHAQKSSGNAVLRLIGTVFTLIFRLGLLTGGAGVALVVGVAIATIRPAEVSEPPVLEKVVQQIDRFRP